MFTVAAINQIVFVKQCKSHGFCTNVPTKSASIEINEIIFNLSHAEIVEI